MLKSIWAAFLKKAGIAIGGAEGVSGAQPEDLAKKAMNGRQVKNTVKISCPPALNRTRKEKLSYTSLGAGVGCDRAVAVEFQNMTLDHL